MPVMFLRAVHTIENKTDMTPAFRKLTFYWGRTVNQINKLIRN